MAKGQVANYVQWKRVGFWRYCDYVSGNQSKSLNELSEKLINKYSINLSPAVYLNLHCARELILRASLAIGQLTKFQLIVSSGGNPQRLFVNFLHNLDSLIGGWGRNRLMDM